MTDHTNQILASGNLSGQAFENLSRNEIFEIIKKEVDSSQQINERLRDVLLNIDITELFLTKFRDRIFEQDMSDEQILEIIYHAKSSFDIEVSSDKHISESEKQQPTQQNNIDYNQPQIPNYNGGTFYPGPVPGLPVPLNSILPNQNFVNISAPIINMTDLNSNIANGVPFPWQNFNAPPVFPPNAGPNVNRFATNIPFNPGNI
ncbi:MAG: hypothetical protein MHPSP_000538 [Paramarteilia canceri]